MTTPVDRVRRALEERDCRITADRGNSFKAQCPAHNPDRHPSLAVGTNQDGRALLNCNRGCSFEAVLDALALTARDLRPRSPSSLSEDLGRFSKIKTGNANYPQPQPRGEFPVNARDSENLRGVSFQEDAWLWRALAEHGKGGLGPEFEVRLRTDRLPTQATTLRGLADRIALAMSLRLTRGETRPMPISGSCAARLLGRDPVAEKRECQRMVTALVERRVLRERDPLDPIRGRPRGTKTFEPHDISLEEIFSGVPTEPALPLAIAPDASFTGLRAGAVSGPARERAGSGRSRSAASYRRPR